MESAELLSKLTDVFRETLDLPTLVLHRELTAPVVDGWDSLAHINLIVAIEKSFRITFTTREVHSLKKVGDLIDIISSKLPS